MNNHLQNVDSELTIQCCGLQLDWNVHVACNTVFGVTVRHSFCKWTKQFIIIIVLYPKTADLQVSKYQWAVGKTYIVAMKQLSIYQ